MKKKKEVMKAFWAAVPDDTTLDKIVDGIDVSFTYSGKDYIINTADKHARTRPIAAYTEKLEQRVVGIVA